MLDFYEIYKWRNQTDCGSIRIGGVSLEVLSHIVSKSNFTSYFQLKGISDLKVRDKTIKLLQKNYHELRFGKGFLDLTLKM